MLKITLLQKLLVISIIMSTITCAFIQKTKKYFKKSRHITIYSLFVNMLFGIVFCITFTDIKFPESLWVGLFTFVGADTIYKSLEGKLASYKDLIRNDTIEVKKENLIEIEDNQ